MAMSDDAAHEKGPVPSIGLHQIYNLGSGIELAG